VQNISGVAENIEEKAKEYLKELEPYCENRTEYVFSIEGNTFSIPCSIVSQENNNSIIERGFEETVKQVYYKEYNCSFWKCLKEDKVPLFLVSAKAQSYWEEKFYLSLTISLVLFILIFLLTSRKYNAFFIGGALIIISSLPFWKLNQIFLKFLGSKIVQFAGIFVSKAGVVFLISLIVGFIFLVVGGLMKAFKIGMKIYKTVSKEEPEKEEKKEEKPKKEKQKPLKKEEKENSKIQRK